MCLFLYHTPFSSSSSTIEPSSHRIHAIYSVCLALCLSSGLHFFLLLLLSIAKCTNTIQCYKDRSLTQFFFLQLPHGSIQFVFFLWHCFCCYCRRCCCYCCCRNFFFILYFLRYFFPLSPPSISLCYLIFLFRFVFCELKTIFTFICKYFFVCVYTGRVCVTMAMGYGMDVYIGQCHWYIYSINGSYVL